MEPAVKLNAFYLNNVVGETRFLEFDTVAELPPRDRPNALKTNFKRQTHRSGCNGWVAFLNKLLEASGVIEADSRTLLSWLVGRIGCPIHPPTHSPATANSRPVSMCKLPHFSFFYLNATATVVIEYPMNEWEVHYYCGAGLASES